MNLLNYFSFNSRRSSFQNVMHCHSANMGIYPDMQINKFTGLCSSSKNVGLDLLVLEG